MVGLNFRFSFGKNLVILLAERSQVEKKLVWVQLQEVSQQGSLRYKLDVGRGVGRKGGVKGKDKGESGRHHQRHDQPLLNTSNFTRLRP